nr:helix-turn-helix transcriptional regulator [Treponema sp.]
MKKYRQGRFTQEALVEEEGLSPQQINGIEGGRKFVSTESLLKIATALDIEVYQLFIPHNSKPVIIEETPENERIRAQLTDEIVEQIRLSVNKSLDKVKNKK